MAGGKDVMKTEKHAEGILANMSKKDRIFMACDSLVRDGHQVTEAIVLSIVGGSSSTIHRYVKEWKELSALREQAPAVPTEFLQSLNALFLTLSEAAEEKSKAHIAELEEKITALEDASRLADEELERRDQKEAELTDSNRTLDARLQSLTTEVEALTAAQTESDKTRAVLEEQVRDLNEEISQRDEAAAKNLEALKGQHKEELDRLQEVYERAENRLFQQMTDLEDRYKAQIRELKIESEQRAAQIKSEAQDEIDRAWTAQKNKAIEYEDAIAELNTELDRSKGSIAEKENEHKSQIEGYALVASAFAELFGIEVDENLRNTKALRKSIRDAKKQFYSSPQHDGGDK